ncbi:sensor histidine kinase [Paenibacillus donghaensis]|uniref:histidine kinase n=1 Tax=Paenibacillus donghaensis TaxID=414771 RepID=A0A2Z2KDZ5_9BACL|nr:HAMP domain-containing sensor histidine kinase [Paenibacillus donghaensis]ASA24244.1 two-component sensor histidine kinase [Paenibacillus donghaensis]
MKLRTRIHLYSSVLFAVLLVLMNLAIYFMFSRLSMNSQLEQAEAEGSQIAAGMHSAAAAADVADLLRAYVPADGMIRLLSEDGSGPAPVTSASEQAISRLPAVYDVHVRSSILHEGGRTYASVSTPVIWADGSVRNVQLTKSLEHTVGTLNVLRVVLAVATLVALLPLVLSSRLLAGIIMKPIVQMTQTMQGIKRSGRFTRLELDDKSRDELVEMGQTFNEMIALLESNYLKQEKFVSDASHELRTPLTVIESYASLLKRRGLEHPELFEESVEAIHSEAIRMKELTEQLLLLARHKDHWNLSLAAVDLEELAEGSARAFRYAYGREVAVSVSPGGVAHGYSDEAKLKQLLFIFLDNARKYSDGEISLTLASAGPECVITIADRGIGIPKAELPKVFDRFYRVDEARGRKQGGAGLGLSLAAEIAEAIGAQLELDSVEGLGTTVKIRIAAAESGGAL